MSSFRNARVMSIIFVGCLLVPQMFLYADEVSLSASKDNSIYFEGDLSNGAGDHLFSGRTASGNDRRALITFDIAASVPMGATIDAVQLTLNVSKTPDSNSHSFSLFKLSVDWGEGISNAPDAEGAGIAAAIGDATWSHTFFDNSFWASAGGDFVSEASATAQIGGTGAVTWLSTAALVADVQQWLDQSNSNFGWLLRGDDAVSGTARRFDSRENRVFTLTPKLEIIFTPETTGACCSIGGACSDIFENACQGSGEVFMSQGSSCALIQECPLFEDGFEN